MSKVQVDTIDTRSGTSTMQIGSTNTTTINLGVSGDTVNIPSGVTIANAGTATGFGVDNTPNFYVIRSGAQAISNNTYSKIQYQSETWDSDSAYDTSNYRFTVPSGEAGKYYFGIIFYLEGLTDGEQFRLKIYKNGSAHAPEPLQQLTMPGSTDASGFASIILNLAASDYVEIFAYHNGDSTENLASGNNVFFGYKLAE